MQKNFLLPVLRLIAGIIISAIALYLAFQKIDIKKIWMVLRSASWFYLLLSSVVIIFSIWILALRWQIILWHSKKVSLRLLLEGQFIGYFGNNVFPLRMGEILRAYVLSKQERIKIAEVMGSIAAERFLDIIIVVCLIIFLLFSGTVFPKSIMPILWIFTLLGVILFAVVAIFPRIEKRLFFSAKIKGLLNAFVRGLHSLRDLKKLPFLILLTLLIWLFYGLAVILVLSAVRIKFGIMLILLILALTALGINVPSAPGSIGTYHLAVIFALHEIAGYEITLSQAASLLYHAASFVPLTLIGLLVFLKSHITLSNVKRVRSNEQ